MSPVVFIAKQLHKIYPHESFIKVGVNTAFVKDKSQNYEFGGRIYLETDDIVLFHGLPKRIEVEGVNLLGALELERDDLLTICYNLKQDITCKFEEKYFEFKGKKYYDVFDLETIQENYQ